MLYGFTPRRERARTVRALLLLSFLALALAPATSPLPPPVGPAAVAADPGEAVVGRGPLDTFACLGCAGAVVGLGGTSVVGVVAVLSAWPEIGIGCGLACYNAFR